MSESNYGESKNLDGILITGIEDDVLEYDNLRYFYPEFPP
jgi:hypothetical protein